jgi:hypothetical protein
MLEVGQFSVGQSYVTAKVRNRHGDVVNINIEGGRLGIDLQETAYIITTINETGKILVRKLPVLGIKDWLLLYEDDLFAGGKGRV